MPHYQKLVGSQCYLSPCSLDDADTWAQWDNDLEVCIPLGDEAYTPISLEKEREMIEGSIRRQDHVFNIVTVEGDRVIGRCLLFHVDAVNRSATLGIAIGDKSCWNHGYGQDAIRLLLDYGFNLLNLNSVMLGVFAFNERAINCYKKVGFKEIGRRRQARIIGGQAFDAILMDILAEEFESPCVKRLLGSVTSR